MVLNYSRVSQTTWVDSIHGFFFGGVLRYSVRMQTIFIALHKYNMIIFPPRGNRITAFYTLMIIYSRFVIIIFFFFLHNFIFVYRVLNPLR